MKQLYAALFSILAMTQTANGQDSGVYIQGTVYGTELTDTHISSNIGLGSVSYDSDTGIGGGGEVGYKFNQYFRVAAEGAYRHNDVSGNGASGEFNSTAAMGNMYLDIPTGSAITPYIGAGVGYAYVTDTSVHDDVFAYQGMAGLSYAATPKTDIVLGYKYFGTTTPRYDLGFGVQASAPYRAHNVELGVRYKF